LLKAEGRLTAFLHVAEEEEGKVEEVTEEKAKKTKKIKEVQHEWDLLNKQKPIW
jgi:molecular chaperone HtpG